MDISDAKGIIELAMWGLSLGQYNFERKSVILNVSQYVDSN